MTRPPPTRRQRRVADLIRQEISRLLTRHLKDVRIAALTTVTDVRVSKDLKHATVCISVMGDERQETSTIVALQHAAGHVQEELGKVLNLRSTPRLRFVADDRIREGDHVLALLKQLERDGGGPPNSEEGTHGDTPDCDR